MIAEHPLQTTERFISSWQKGNTDPSRIAVELTSVNRETYRQPDNFYLLVEDGELIDPVTRRVIEFNRTSELEIKEGRVFDKLKNFAIASESGSAIWISPLLGSTRHDFNGLTLTTDAVYPTNKITLYQIAYTLEFPPQKVILGTTILFDTPKNHCLDVAKEITSAIDYKNPEELRDELLIKNGDITLTSLLEILGQNKNNEIPTPSQELINYFVEEITSGRDPRSLTLEMQQRGVLGEHSISCPTGSSNALLSHSRILNFTEGITDFEEIIECTHCPFCERTVKAGIKSGRIHCLNCTKSAPYTRSN